jgi:DNA-directed RNA polymerase subunit RPC12/RpoP
MAFVVICPGCAIRLTLGDDRAGTTLACPNCESSITVPTTPAQLAHATALPPVKKQSKPAIEFLCPACRARMRISHRKAAAEIRCPKCDQRVIVPTPPDRPLEGILIEPGTAPIPAPVRHDSGSASSADTSPPVLIAPEPLDLDESDSGPKAENPSSVLTALPAVPQSARVVEWNADEEEDEENDVTIQRRRRSRWRTLVLILAAASCSACFLGGTAQSLIAKNAELQAEEYTKAGRKVTPETYIEIDHQKDRALVMFALAGVAGVSIVFVLLTGRRTQRLTP